MKEYLTTTDLLSKQQNHQKPKGHGKQWMRVRNGTHPNNYKQFIHSKIFEYDAVLAEIKATCLKQGDIYFERDYRWDGVDPYSIHSFITPTFYWTIDCDPVYDIHIEYHFEDCPFETQARAILRKFYLHDFPTLKQLNKPLKVFFKAVQAYQHPQFIHIKT